MSTANENDSETVPIELDIAKVRACTRPFDPTRYLKTEEDIWSLAIPGARKMSFQEMEAAIQKGAVR